MYTILLVIDTIIVVFLIMMVLIQRSDSDGMGGLGGGGGNQFMTGRAQANFMTRTTAVLAAAFMIISLVLATMASRMSEGSIVDNVAMEKIQKKTDDSVDEVPTAKTAPVKKAAAPAVPKPE